MDTAKRGFFKSLIPNVNSGKSPQGTASIVTLGHLAVFPVNSSIKVKLMEREFLAESLPEGIRLKSLITNENIKLTIGDDGLIQAHLNEFWPATAVLSIFTGGIYNI